jgi:ribonuclease HI
MWKVPETGYHKMNFDGASKGNLGLVGYEAVIHNNKGEILHIVEGSIGPNTNNVVEIWSLLRGLQEPKDQELFPIIAKGDSQILIHLFSYLLNGVDPEKFSLGWRLMNGILRIKSLLHPN